MKKLFYSTATCFLVAACGQVSPDTYKKAGSTYGQDDGVFTDASGNLHFILNGTTVGNLSSAGNLTLSGSVTGQSMTPADDSDIVFGTGSDFGITFDVTGQTPDSAFMGVGSESRQLVLAEWADVGTDLTLAQQTNPTLNIHSADATQSTQWISVAHDQTNGVVDVGAGQVSIPDGITTGAGVGAVTFTASTASIAVGDNDASALDIGSTDATDLIRLDTTNDAETVIITGYAGQASLDVAAGTALLRENVTIGAATAATDYTVTFNGETNDCAFTCMEDETRLDVESNLQFGSGGAGVDYTFTADGETSDGKITYMEDEDRWDINEALQVDTTIAFGSGGAGVDYTISVNGETNDDSITYMEDEDRWDFAGNAKVTGDLTCGGGAGAIDVSGSGDSSLLMADADSTAFCMGATGALDLVCIDTTDASPSLDVKGVAGQIALHVDAGTVQLDENVTVGAGAAGIDYQIAFNGETTDGTIIYMEDETRLDVESNLEFGAGGAGVDYTLTANGETADGTITWMEDESDWKFANDVDVDGDIFAGGGAGALTFDAASSSIVCTDNSATGLVVGAAGLTTMITLDTQDNAEAVMFGSGVKYGTTSITGSVSLDASDCGKWHFVADGIDGNTITLPATIAGCELNFMFVGSDGGALLDISPNASDAIHGSCYETATDTVVEFSGADNADIGCTKATINTADHIRLIGDGDQGWYSMECEGIWANN